MQWGLTFWNLNKHHCFIVLHITIRRSLELCFGEESPPKPLRGDGTVWQNFSLLFNATDSERYIVRFRNMSSLQDMLNFLLISIADFPFRIMTCRFLLAVVSRTWDLICINLSFASRDFACARSTASTQSPRLCIAFGVVHRRGHHAFRESSFVSLAHGTCWLFLLSHHHKAFLLLLIRSHL